MKFILLFVLLLFFHDPMLGTNVQKRIDSVPIEDQKKMEILFHHMMTGDYFACTLFGNKPITFQEFYEDPWKLHSSSMLNPHYYHYLEEGYKTWLMHKEKFMSDRFIFTKIPSKVGYAFLFLVNKEAFANIFHKNQRLFQDVLGSEVTVEKIYRDIEEGKETFEQIFNDHEGLIGLILGYGRVASMESYHMYALTTELLRKSLHPLSLSIKEKNIPPCLQFSMQLREKKYAQRGIRWDQLPKTSLSVTKDLYKELEEEMSSSAFFHPTWNELVVHILPPNFSCCKNAEETKVLKKEYDLAMRAARKKFRNSSFLIGFLEQYCGKGEI